MSIIPCKGCGRTTNSALSKHNFKFVGGEAEHCYAAWDESTQRWVKGCGFEQGDDFQKMFALKVINSERNTRQ